VVEEIDLFSGYFVVKIKKKKKQIGFRRKKFS